MLKFHRSLTVPARSLLAAALVLASFPGLALAVPDAWDDGFGLVGADGAIHAAIVAEESITVGGAIAVIGGATVGNVAQWDGSAWNAMGLPFNGVVRSLVEKDGTIYAGGEFTKASFTNMARVAKWNGTAWSALGAGIQGPAQGTRVNSVTFFQGNLYVAGNFTKAGSVTAADIAYWDGALWHAIGSTNSGAELHEMVVYGDRLCVVGAFTKIGNLETEGVACWTGTEWESLGSGLNGTALAAATLNGYLYVGGSFSFAGGKSARRVARWTGSAWESLDFPLLQSAVSIGFRGNTVVVGVSNGSIADPAQPWLIEWNGAAWSNAAVQPDGIVHALVPSDFGLLAVGSFPRAGEVVLGGIGFWSGLAWTRFLEPGQRGLHGVAQAFATYQGQLYVAGGFKAGGEVPATLVARWNADHWEVVGNTAAGSNASVDALVVMDDGLYAGGRFSTIGAVEARNIARWNGIEWTAVGAGTDDRIWALHALDGKLFAGGEFENVFGNEEESTPALHIAAWDGAAWSALGAGVDGNVYALGQFAGELVAGGAFLNAGEINAPRVAQWDGIAWHAAGSGLEGPVYALHTVGDQLFAGGTITATGVTPLSGIARWNGVEWIALGAGVTEGAGVGTVRALTSFGDNLFVGGSFGFAGGIEASQIAGYDGENWFAIEPGFRRPSTSGGERVNALLVHDQALWVGGSFVALADGTPAARITAWLGCAAGNEIACTPSTTTTTTTTSSTTTSTLPVEPSCGDANGDGIVTAGDALLALRAAVGSDECELAVCDADHNGEVSAGDSLAILRFAVGLPANLNCPLP
ncbi:MAG: dockerin type I repeat-containing protein [Candidatus Binatia bacterium]